MTYYVIQQLFCLLFFFKQKTAYEMRISDWSSDVCSSDLSKANYDAQQYALQIAQANVVVAQRNLDDTVVRAPFSGVITTKAAQPGEKIGRASCRERVCQSV